MSQGAGIDATTGTAAALTTGGGLGYLLSQWQLAVQAGAVGISIVLAWVVWKLWERYEAKTHAMEKLFQDRIDEKQKDAVLDRESTMHLVEELTKTRQVLEESSRSLGELTRRIERLERSCADVLLQSTNRPQST